MKTKTAIILGFAALLSLSCNKDLDLYPHSSVSPDGVTVSDLPSMRTGMYNRVQTDPSLYTYIGFDFLGGDMIYSQSASPAQTIQTYMTATSGHMSNPWNGIYEALYQVNNVLHVCERFPEDANANLYAGECHFFRALLYTDLVIRYGDVPLLKENTVEKVARAPKAEVWSFIDGEIALAEKMVTTKKSDYMVSADAVQALKARVLLYEGKKAEAARVAEALIASGRYSLDDPDNIWGTVSGRQEASANKENIFSFANVATEDGFYLGTQLFTYGYVNGGGGWYYLTDEFYASFEENDIRKTKYIYVESTDPKIQYHYCLNKYRGGQKFTSPIPVFRISEMYFIAAEGQGVAGMKRLNEFRATRGLGPVTVSTEAEALDAVLKERQHELVGEGHRWYDLVRTGKFVSTIHSPEVQDFHCLFAIPQTQITINDLLTQNPVY